MQEEAIPHVTAGSNGRAQALLEYGCEEPFDLLVSGVSSAPRDVGGREARSVADVLDETFDEHEKSCEACRKAKHSLGNASMRGLARLTRVSATRRPATWQLLCPEGKRLFITSWTSLGLGLPEYAR